MKKKSNRRLRVAVLSGGWGGERPISLMSGRKVLQGLQDAGLEAFALELTSRDRNPARLKARLKRARMDVAFNILHGTFGEDGRLQAVLDELGIPYPGSGAVSSALAMQKAFAKLIFEEKGIPTAPWQALNREMSERDLIREIRVPMPLVVKPAESGSALGVSIVKKKSQIKSALKKAFRESDWAVVEQFVPGVEITVAVLGNRALPVTEIVPKNEFYDLDAKYTPGQSVHIIPARIPARLRREAQALAVKAGQALGCCDFYRVDFIVPKRGWKNRTPQTLEVNTLPGMTDTSLYPEAAKAVGISFPRLLETLVKMALKKKSRPTP